MAPRYVGQYSAEVPEVFKYSSDTDHEKTHASLSTKCKEMKLRSQLSYEFVSKYLTKYNQCAISTKVDNNSLIHSVIVQLKTLKGLTSQIVRHQLAQYMASEVVFFFPIVKEYLEKHRISYNSYVKGIYHGTIWADKYIIGVLSRMLNIKITVISPFYSDVWNVFHRSTMPDVIIVSNGGDFGAKNAVTHFTATHGTENVWKCVGSDIAVGEIGHYSKESEGRTYAIYVFEVEEKKKMTIKVQKITMDIDELSKDLKEICIRRDQILNEMSDIKVDIEELKRFSRYHPEKQHKHSHKRKVEEKPKISKPEKKKKSFPAELGEKLIKDVTSEDPYDFFDIQELKKLYAPARTHCHTKQPGQSAPSTAVAANIQLPSLTDVEEVLGEELSQEPGTFTERTMPTLRETAHEDVITEQPKRTIDDFFPKEMSYRQEVENLPKLNELPPDPDHTTRINYGGIPMTKQVAEELEKNKRKSKNEIAAVHKKNVTCGETYVDIEKDDEGNVLASNSEVNILLPSDDDKSKGKTKADDKDIIEITDSEKESTTTKKILQPTAAEIEAYKITVSVPVDTSKLPPPVPKGQQDPNFFYCTMCDKRFKQRRHQQEHIKEYCSYLTEKVKIQCPHGECGNLFTHVKNFRDHLSLKHGAKEQHQCMKCGKKFNYQRL